MIQLNEFEQAVSNPGVAVALQLLGLIQLPPTLLALRDLWSEARYNREKSRTIREQRARFSSRKSYSLELLRSGSTPDWRSRVPEAHVTSVVSGKGGVGKSCIALGLLEYHSMFGHTLLVDMDLHNQGLTSLLMGRTGVVDQGYDTTYGELERFQREVVQSVRRNLGPDRELHPSTISPSNWEPLVRSYTRGALDGQEVRRAVRSLNFSSTHRVYSKLYEGVVGIGNASFLPARRDSQRLFLSKVAEMNHVDVFLFIKALAALAHDNAVRELIIDCHGAQDMFSIGALLASEHVVVVANEDPGSFEGTAELATIARDIVKSDFLPNSLSVVVNQSRGSRSSQQARENFQAILDYPSGDQREAKGAKQAEKGRAHEFTTTCIRHDDRIRRRLHGYRFPSVVHVPSLWREMSQIARPTATHSGLAPTAKGTTTPPLSASSDPDPGTRSSLDTASLQRKKA